MSIRIILISLVLSLSTLPVAQAKDEGLYIGAGIGLVAVEQKIPIEGPAGLEIDDSDVATKLFVGYQFSELLAMEGGYRDLGKPSSRGAVTRLDGWDVFGVLGLPLGPVRAFGKAGGIYSSAETRIGGVSVRSHSQFDLGLGVGLEFEIMSMAIRGEIEYFDVLDAAVMYSLGATYTF